jgi:hypothetical protein
MGIFTHYQKNKYGVETYAFGFLKDKPLDFTQFINNKTSAKFKVKKSN